MTTCDATPALIRPASRGDVDDLHGLRRRALWTSAGRGYSNKQIAAWVRARPPADLLRGVESTSELFFVAQRGPDIVGYASLALLPRTHLWSLYVRPELAGLGFGRRLLGAAEGTCRRLGIEILYVSASVDAASFYARMGYCREQAFEVYLPDRDGLVVATAIKMTKNLRGRQGLPREA